MFEQPVTLLAARYNIRKYLMERNIVARSRDPQPLINLVRDGEQVNLVIKHSDLPG
jgi:hypothetical protein